MKLVQGVGINDADYSVTQYEIVGGKQRIVWRCPFYAAWTDMLKRCYSPAYKSKHKTYRDCCVCADWIKFSQFREWMAEQDWKGKQLDKDILTTGNKVYGPDTCVFVDQATNKFLTDHGSSRGEFPLGVSFHNHSGKLRAQCRNPVTGKNEHIGHFTDPAIAHKSWKTRKHELSLELADRQTDQRVAEALRQRFSGE